ncbi:sugar kinase [Kocuria flava]|uniref:Gluconate kinase n=1 Tax=Kocuria flava TaxID=446860 RepID=A0A0U2NWC5_9MICC|nr:gluconokinase [Kocuria flava]ALU38525.1 sugar kinase [Kocuria flava]GEO92776.1 gluconate kinase [Kocuria flava]
MSTRPAPPRPQDGTSFSVELADALDPLVLALDVGSTASRGGLHDATGTPVRGYRHKIEHAFTTAGDGTSVLDPDRVVEELARITDLVVAGPELRGRVAGVALDTFASSLVGTGPDGAALTPCYTYADSRCAPQLAALRAELDEAEVQQRTGARLHTSYLAPRLRWLREENPGTWGRVARWVSLGEYVHLRLLGAARAGTSTAAWTGLLDRRTGRWDEALLAACGLEPSALGELADPQDPLLNVDPAVGRRWPNLAAAAWFPPVADGLGANLGSGGADAATTVVSLATSGAARVLLHEIPEEVPAGLWCYRVDARRCLLGGALNDVGRALSWVQRTLALPEGTDLDGIARAEPSPGTPAVLPFLTGERSTGWAGGARAVLAGVTADHDGPALARGVLEGIGVSYGRVADELARAAPGAERVVASGRVAQEVPGLLQVLADVLGAPVARADFKRATLRGTALLALETLAAGVVPAEPPYGPEHRPVPARAEHYRGVRDRFEELYAALVR